MMKVTVMHPQKIVIGENTTVNEYCYLDGRGHLSIGSNTNIAIGSMLITGTHHMTAADFGYYTEPVTVGDDVWVASRAIVLNGCTLGNRCVIGAGAVVPSGTLCKENSVYGGNPAVLVRGRGLRESLALTHWNIHFR